MSIRIPEVATPIFQMTGGSVQKKKKINVGGGPSTYYKKNTSAATNTGSL